MWKALIAGTAAVIAGSSLLFAQQPPAPAAATPTGEQHDQDTGWQPSAEDDQENSPHWRPSAEDVRAFMDARIAALKAGTQAYPRSGEELARI